MSETMTVFTVGYRGSNKSTILLHSKCHRYGPACWRNCHLKNVNCVCPEKRGKKISDEGRERLEDRN